MLKNYKIGFDKLALLIFIIIMLPNIYWGFNPPINDALRNESITRVTDIIGMICQVVFITLLCIVVKKKKVKFKITLNIIMVILCIILYYIGWILYYNGITNAFVFMLLSLAPCFTFIFYEIDKKHKLAIIPTIIFTICHLIYATVNFVF